MMYCVCRAFKGTRGWTEGVHNLGAAAAKSLQSCPTLCDPIDGIPRPWDSPGKNTRVGCHFLLQCMKVKSESEVAQLCLTLSDPMDCSLPGSSIHGIFQARVLEWGAIAFSANYRDYHTNQENFLWNNWLYIIWLYVFYMLFFVNQFILFVY